MPISLIQFCTMKTLFTFLFFVTLLTQSIHAQRIHVTNVGGTYFFAHDGDRLDFKEIRSMARHNYDALRVLQRAQGWKNGANVFSFVGGFLIGWPLGATIFGNDPNWNLALYGLAAVLVSVPLASKSTQITKEAVDIYNGGLEATSFRYETIQLSLSSTAHGVGFLVSF